MKIVIIGGVAGGMSAATRLRRLDNKADIVVVERSGHVSYANCGLAYFMGGVIEDESSLLLQTPTSLHDRFRLDVRVASEAIAIDPTLKTVTVRNLSSGETYQLSYDYVGRQHSVECCRHRWRIHRRGDRRESSASWHRHHDRGGVAADTGATRSRDGPASR